MLTSYTVVMDEHRDLDLIDHIEALHESMGNSHVGLRDIESLRNGASELGLLNLDSALQRSLSRRVRDTIEDEHHPYLEQSPVYQQMREDFDREGLAGPPLGSKSQNYK